MPELGLSHNLVEYSVSEISGAVKRVVEDNFGYVRVRGEVSGLKLHSSGHCYMALKDENSSMNAVCWKGNYTKLTFKPEDGLEVICQGRITTYPGKSQYQLVIDHMEPAGVGALMALLEQLKKKLAAEGLFDANRKRPLPYLPQVVGVVTSPTGAVIRDILHRLGDRFPLRVIVWPVAVQGEGAAQQVADAIQGFNRLEPDATIPRPDVLIVARGGGSIEDLWAFNEEVVVRAAATSSIPIISAVGHETDTTLIDYVSDLRAPTPTGAAEKAVPVRRELQLLVQEYQSRMFAAVTRLIDERQALIAALVRGLPKPAQVLEAATQRLDDWNERLRRALPALLEAKRAVLGTAAAGLTPLTVRRGLHLGEERVSQLSSRLTLAHIRRLEREGDRLESLGRLLGSFHYKNVLKRGFALVRTADGEIVTQVAHAPQGTSLTVEVSDGVFTAAAGDGSALPHSAAKPKMKTKAVPPHQSGLFD